MMGEYVLNQKGAFFLAAFLILAASFLFRQNISEFLSFGERREAHEEVGTPPREVPPPEKESASLPIPEPPQVLKKHLSGVPLYEGRDPEEVRPVPEEVKLFTEAQKAQFYETIRTHGREVKTSPRYFYGWIQLGLLKKIIGDFIGARDAWEYAGIIEPLNSLSFSNLGELYWRYIHDYPSSEANFKISIKHKPNDIQNYISLAELYHYSYKDKADLADDIMLQGLEANPGDETLMRRLAYLYEQRKDLGKALEWWQKVWEVTPNDSEVKSRIEKLKVQVGGAGQ